MLKESQKEKYLESKQYQKDCTEFNDKLLDLLTHHSHLLSSNRFHKFAEIVLPTLLIHHISHYFEHHLIHNEESVDAFVGSIKSSIMEHCNIEPQYDDYKLIEDVGAVA